MNLPSPPASLNEALYQLINKILPELSTGDVAQLKRMQEKKCYVPAFWCLWNWFSPACRYPRSPKTINPEQAWARVIQALAMLRPAGQGERKLPHDRRIKLGAALWGPDTKSTAIPVVSPLRMARLLSAPYHKRAALMQRLVPLLKGQDFNLEELGAFLFNPSDAACRQIARAYYR